jgi:hypothetical protein
MMTDTHIDEQLRLLQQQMVVVGETIESLQLETRAAIDAVHLEIEVLRRCLRLVHPDMAESFAAVRTETIHTTDPETPHPASEDT